MTVLVKSWMTWELMIGSSLVEASIGQAFKSLYVVVTTSIRQVVNPACRPIVLQPHVRAVPLGYQLLVIRKEAHDPQKYTLITNGIHASAPAEHVKQRVELDYIH